LIAANIAARLHMRKRNAKLPVGRIFFEWRGCCNNLSQIAPKVVSPHADGLTSLLQKIFHL
jgi:hypothetical protein